MTARAHLDPQPDGDVFWNGVVLDVSELELARQAMLAAKEEAERANDAKSQSLSAHEPRTAHAAQRQLRANPATHHLPVLMLNTDATSTSRENLLALGADDCLPKPFNVMTLLEKMDVLLKLGRSRVPS